MLSLICPWHCSHRGTESGAACLSCQFKLQTQLWGSMSVFSGSPVPKTGTTADSSQAEEAIQEGFAKPHLPMALLAQRHRDWGCLLVLQPQTSNLALEWGGPCQEQSAALLRKCERLQIGLSPKGTAWKAVAQPHLPMALLTQRHRDWGCLLVLPPQTSNAALGVSAGLLRQPFSENANVCRYLAGRKS